MLRLGDWLITSIFPILDQLALTPTDNLSHRNGQPCNVSNPSCPCMKNPSCFFWVKLF